MSKFQKPTIPANYLHYLRTQTWALSQLCISLAPSPQHLKEFAPRAFCNGNTTLLQLSFFVLQQLDIYQTIPLIDDPVVVVNCINTLSCFASHTKIFWSVPGMKENILRLLVMTMQRTWRTNRQANIVLESCLWCFECMFLALPPKSSTFAAFSMQLLRSTRYVNILVQLMSTLEEDESKGLSQAMITSLQRGALMNVGLLIRNETALNALGSSDTFVKGLVDVLLDNDRSSASHAATAARTFYEIAQRGSGATRKHMLRCGVSGALFRSLSSFKQTDKLLAETYGLSYAVIYNVDLVTNVFHCLRILLLNDVNMNDVIKYVLGVAH